MLLIYPIAIGSQHIHDTKERTGSVGTDYGLGKP
jgi:hypothetical protein